ncbi:PTS cellobiose transporter subunit IIB [Paenibacillus sp. FSL P4-0081]|uniref:PTS sugar transporter subunit IIB n=1 Tax=unclassified Paenibacillus TaxID=185978 RepID=UPI0004F76F84|nr:PTS sugar transporter subunit IIB [Paenibacillus sp. FSL P4-0081]AIQ31561.1 PTS cellobiose transporter subunit IIB [Paenibacillus sp. FSL P4-0081]
MKVTLVCAAGMSTSILVQKIKAAAEKAGEPLTIRAVSETDFSKYANDTEVLLLGPQIGYSLGKLKNEYEPRGIKVAVINTVDYGMMNGEKVLKFAKDLLANK